MKKTTTQLRDLIQASRAIQKAREDLACQLIQLDTPMLSDTSKLQSLYASIQSQTSSDSLREQRLCFVFVAAYLYSPASIYGDCHLKAGLRSHISRTIGRCKGEVSEMLAAAKFRYEKLPAFGEKIDNILAQYLHNNN